MNQYKERYGDFEIYSDPTAPKYLPAGDMVGWVVGVFVRRIGDAKPVMRFVHFLSNKQQALAVVKAKKWIDENPKARLKDSRALTLQEKALTPKKAKKPEPEPEEEEPKDPLKGQAAFKRNLANFEKGKKTKTAIEPPRATNAAEEDEEDF